MTDPVADWRDQLFEHRSYWQLVRAVTRKSLKRSATRTVCFLLLSIGGFAIDQELLDGQWAGGALAVTFVRSWAVSGLEFGSAMLAFLIAGFTIFATVTDVRVFEALASIKQDDDSSHLRAIFRNFMMDFWQFIVFLFICIVIGFFFGEDAPLTILLGWTLRGHPIMREILIHSCVGILALYFLMLVLTVKSFIWNVYQAIFLAIALKSEHLDKQK
jgi:hypothetical protein